MTKLISSTEIEGQNFKFTSDELLAATDNLIDCEPIEIENDFTEEDADLLMRSGRYKMHQSCDLQKSSS